MDKPKLLVIAIISCILLIGVVGLVLRFSSENASSTKQTHSKKAASGSEKSCGGKRWDIKTLTDKDSGLVKMQVQDTTVKSLVSGPKFVVQQTTARTIGYEDQIFRVRANLVEVKHSVDQDLQLIIADPQNPALTMIVEMPDPACFGKQKAKPSKEQVLAMTTARANFTAVCGSFTENRDYGLDGQATLAGVRFIDIPHKAKKGSRAGEAQDHVELHPLVSFSATSCKRTNTVPIPGARD